MEALVKNAADENQVKAASRKEKFGKDKELAELKEVLSSYAGRSFIWRYLGICGLDRLSFGASNEQTNFAEGQRNVGLRMKAEVIECDPESYLKMIMEAKEGKYGN